VALIERSDALPHGHALDLGCGTGTDSIYLAQHGWHVMGVDMVPEALAIAHRSAAAAGVAATFDFGCFHTLPTERSAYVENVSTVAAPGAVFLLYCFARPPRYPPMQAGVSPKEVRERFAIKWEIQSADRSFELWRFSLRRLA
jgi:SAM-dependent methyltransferase